MNTVTEVVINRTRLRKVSHDLWECLNDVRQGSSTEEQRECLDRYYDELKSIMDDYYSELPRVDSQGHDLWFSRMVLEAYRDLRHSLYF